MERYNCFEIGAKVLSTDTLKWLPLNTVSVGQSILAFDEKAIPGERLRNPDGSWVGAGDRTARKTKVAKVLEIEKVIVQATRVYYSDGSHIDIGSDTYSLGMAKKDRNHRWYKADLVKQDQRFIKYLNVWEVDKSYEAGWLSGFISGEGTLKQGGKSFAIDFCQRPGYTWDTALEYCKKLGIPMSPYRTPKGGGLGRGDCQYIGLLGSKFKILEYIGKFQITRFVNNKINWETFGGFKGRDLTELSVVGIENLGIRELYKLRTDTKTAVVNGLAFHA